MVQLHDDFESITQDDALVANLRERIAREGPLTFRAFMESALYDPRHGYYSTRAGAMGRGGDYVTSPEVHPVFAALVCKQLLEMWQILSRPDSFEVVEQGGGSGGLARDILRAAARGDPAFAAALRYTLVEMTPAQARAERDTLDDAGLAGRVRLLDTLPDAVDGVLLSNELVDAFPVHRVVVRDGDLLENYVDEDGHGGFHDAPGPLSTPALREYFDAAGVRPGEGCLAEVNLDAIAWVTRAAGVLRHGYMLTFDYGYEAADLYAPWRRDGTLLCFHRQTASSDPYRRIGRQDITASIDFTSLRRAGEAAGLVTIGLADQAAFLTRLGISHGLATLAREQPQAIEEYYARRKVVLDLIDPARLGRIRVLAQAKGVPAAPLRGFHDDAPPP